MRCGLGAGFMLLLVLSACGPALVVEYSRREASWSDDDLRVQLATVDDVQVYYMSMPAGLVMTEEGVFAREGHEHIVLGEVQARIKRCDDSNGVRAAVVRALQEKAFAVGATALVYATAQLPQSYNEATCMIAVTTGKVIGRGWAVIKRD